MHPPLLSLRRWQVAGPLAVVLVAFALLVAVRPEYGETLGPAGMMVGMGTAGAIMWVRSVDLSTRERRAWRMAAIGLFFAAAGVLATAILVVAGVDLPAFGPTDVFFLFTYVSLVAAIVLLARAEAVGRDWVVTVLDAMIGGIALVAMVWGSIREDLLASLQDAPRWELAVALLYPVIDIIALIALMILVLRRSTFRLDMRLFFLALTLGFQFLADLGFLRDGLGRTFQDIEPLYPLFLMSGACSVMAAAIVDRTPLLREYPERNAPLLALMWPYLLVVALLVTHVVAYSRLTGGRSFALDSLLVIVVLALVRQLVVIQGHRHQIENQRSELVASVSHELRTPLTAIVGYLSLIDEEGDHLSEETRREMLADVTDQAKHMARLVSDLMLLARGFDRRVPLEVSEITVSELVRDTLAELPDVEIEVEITDDSVIRVDPDRMRQAIANMVTNAHKYGEGRILLRSLVRHERTLVIEVHDDGPGVPARYENLIWERFERGAKRLDSTKPGMGIGLAILRAVAESHGGSAAYRRSEILGGACFNLRIPGCVVARPVNLRLARRSRTTASRRPTR